MAASDVPEGRANELPCSRVGQSLRLIQNKLAASGRRTSPVSVVAEAGSGKSTSESKSCGDTGSRYVEWRAFRELAKPQYFRMLAVINRALDSANLPVPPPHLLSPPAISEWQRPSMDSGDQPDVACDSRQFDT